MNQPQKGASSADQPGIKPPSTKIFLIAGPQLNS